VVAGCLIGAAGLLVAQDLSKLTGVQREQLNAWMAERAERMIAVHRLEGELTQAVNDTANTSPEIEALRKRCQDLQNELSRAQADLQKKVLALPALQEKRTKLEQERQSINEISNKVKALTDPVR
jgi:chromosome segregation ATPase